jgi:hypothetical protein
MFPLAQLCIREDWEACPFLHTSSFLETSHMTGFLMADVSQQSYIMVVRAQLQSAWQRAAQLLLFRFLATKDSGVSYCDPGSASAHRKCL